MGLTVTDSGGPTLTEMLKVNKTLQGLHMSGNIGVTDMGAFFIAEGLKHNSGLRDSGITTEGAKSIADALKVNRTLEHLDISCNIIGDTFVHHMAEGLKSNSGLKYLDLWKCGITAEGGNSIADALEVNRTLEHLNISCNNIGDIGFVHIAEALKSNHALKRLELADCEPTEKGLTVLSISLVENKCLQYLNIGTQRHGYTTRHVDQKCLNQFVSCLQENLHLTRLRLGPARELYLQSWEDTLFKGELSALNQVRRDKCLQELEIDYVYGSHTFTI